jgi:alpha-L-rhamnosidase
MIANGATTIWETWKESDNTYSNCHPMFGTVTEWYYRWLGGIRPDPENPGFKEFIIAPSTPEGLDYVNCTYHSPFGKIVSNWRREKSDNYLFKIEIPAGSKAQVILSVNQNTQLNVEKDGEKVEYKGLKNGSFELGEGNYTITLMN